MLARSIAVGLLVTSFAYQPCQSQQEDLFDLGSPFVGEAVDGWESDAVATLWYEQTAGELRYYAPIIDDQLVASSLSLFSDQPVFKADVVPPTLTGSFDQLTPTSVFKATFGSAFTDVDFGPLMQPELNLDFFLSSVVVTLTLQDAFPPDVDIAVSTPEQPRPAPPVRRFVLPPFFIPNSPVFIPNVRFPGDTDRDGDFDQYDVIQAVSSDKYRTGIAATWGEGDWDGGESSPDEPAPLGDGVFDATDVLAAKATGTYRAGPYTDRTTDNRIVSPILCCGQEGDDKTSIVYDAGTGELSVDSPSGAQVLSSINIESAAGVFSGDDVPRRLRRSAFEVDDDHTIFKTNYGGAFIPEVHRDPYFGSLSFGNVAQPGLSEDFLLGDLSVSGSAKGVVILDAIDLVYLGTSILLQAGDANRDLSFDQLDLVRVLQSGKYLTGQAATWGEGDWNGAPGGSMNEPPQGDGLFNQADIVAALQAGVYLTGTYAAIQPNGVAGDGRTSVIYNPSTGELLVDAPAGTELTSINIDSAASIFTGQPAQNLSGSFDNDSDDNIFKATFGGSFGSLSFGNVAQPGLTADFLLNDLSVVGSLQGGGPLGEVDLIYVPEPSGVLLFGIAMFSIFKCRRHTTGSRFD